MSFTSFITLYAVFCMFFSPLLNLLRDMLLQGYILKKDIFFSDQCTLYRGPYGTFLIEKLSNFFLSVQEEPGVHLSQVENSDPDPEGMRKLLVSEREIEEERMVREREEERMRKEREEEDELVRNKLFNLQRCANNPTLEDYYPRTRD